MPCRQSDTLGYTRRPNTCLSPASLRTTRCKYGLWDQKAGSLWSPRIMYSPAWSLTRADCKRGPLPLTSPPVPTPLPCAPARSQAAWSRLPAQVYGHGGNTLPLLHVHDLASYLLALDAAHVAPCGLGQTRGLGARPGTSGGAAPEQGPAAGEAAGGTGVLLRPGTSRAGTGLLLNGGGTGPLPWGSLPQYLLVCDGSRCTQQEVVAALSMQLGDGSVT